MELMVFIYLKESYAEFGPDGDPIDTRPNPVSDLHHQTSRLDWVNNRLQADVYRWRNALKCSAK